MTIDALTAVYVGNAVAVALLVVLLVGSLGVVGDKDSGRVRLLMVVSLSCSLIDCFVFAADGRPGVLNAAVNYLGNSWLFLANIVTCKIWYDFISDHLGVRVSRKIEMVMDMLLMLGALCIVVNFFYPLVFCIDENNVYHRTYLFWLYVAIAGTYILSSVALYVRARRKGGVLKFFPIWTFISPVVVGALAQSLVYGLSLVWPCVAVGIAGLAVALKNEAIFRDRMTGLFNRAYLDYLRSRIGKSAAPHFTGIMIDLNDFKSINDDYGHAAGDEALVAAARIFRDVVGEMGSVVRYAGDEFVILLNTTEESRIHWVIDTIRSELVNYNEIGGKPYKLSASMGYATLDLNAQTIDEFMNDIDKKMYEDKLEYYRVQTALGHDRRKR